MADVLFEPFYPSNNSSRIQDRVYIKTAIRIQNDDNPNLTHRNTSMKQAIMDLLAEEVRPEHSGRGFYPRVFLKMKHGLILNLKRLSKTILYRKFKIESIFTVKSLLPEAAFLATLDLKDAYHLHVPIHANH